MLPKNELKNIYGDINGEKIFNFAKSIKLFGIDFALNYDKSKSVEENIAHYSGNFVEIAAVGYGVTSAIVGAGISISGGFLVVGATAITVGITEDLKRLVLN